MEITIGKKKYQLYFGVRFVRELDKIGGIQMRGQHFGMALTMALPALQGYDPAVLSDVIYAAAYDNKPRPTREEVDDFIDHTDKLEELFDQVEAAIKESNAVSLAVKNLQA